jgi:hypothetical protein
LHIFRASSYAKIKIPLRVYNLLRLSLSCIWSCYTVDYIVYRIKFKITANEIEDKMYRLLETALIRHTFIHAVVPRHPAEMSA